MPSFLELLEGHEVLASIKAEGARRRRRRHRRNLALGSGVALVLLAAPIVALSSGGSDDEDDVVAAADPDPARRSTTTVPRVTTTTTAPVTTETVPTEVLGVVIERTTTTTRPRGTTPAPTTTVPCRNSTNSDCGDFFWDPPPAANQPLVLDALGDPIVVEAGTTTQIVVAWSDGDATLSFHDSTADDGVLLAIACVTEQRFGPWTPPAASGGSGTISFSYTAPSDRDSDLVQVNAATGPCDGYHPYHSQANLGIPITITPATTTSTTTA